MKGVQGQRGDPQADAFKALDSAGTGSADMAALRRLLEQLPGLGKVHAPCAVPPLGVRALQRGYIGSHGRVCTCISRNATPQALYSATRERRRLCSVVSPRAPYSAALGPCSAARLHRQPWSRVYMHLAQCHPPGIVLWQREIAGDCALWCPHALRTVLHLDR